MSYEIINSDCLKAMQKMPDGSVDAIVTDPLKPRTYILAFDADTDGANDVFRFFKGRGIHGKGKCLGGIYNHDRVCDAAIKEVSHG